MEDLIKETINQAKRYMEILPYWQQESVERVIKEAIQLAYSQGRDDQKYFSEGPKKSISHIEEYHERKPS